MNAEEAYGKALVEDKRFSELESVILQDAQFSYYYAKNILKGRWKEGETIMATDAFFYCFYAENALKWRIKNNKDFYISAASILWDQFPKEIKNDPDIMTAYFKEAVLK